MSAPSRRPEIRRRRARKENFAKLRRKYAKANSDAERTRIVEKLRRVSCGLNVEDFVKSAAAQKA